MDSRSLSRELSLISLGIVNDNHQLNEDDLKKIHIDKVLEAALDLLTNHCREELEDCAITLESASQNLVDSELRDFDNKFFEKIRNDLKQSFLNIELVLNTLSDALELPKLIALSDNEDLRNDIKKRISNVFSNISLIDKNIDNVMEGWRFKRLPRIDRDILRLAYVDINYLGTPVSVACNEAVNLANRYSDQQGRKMINGVLRRLQSVPKK